MSEQKSYGAATNAYGTTAASTDQRALEGKILLKSATQLELLARSLGSAEKPSVHQVSEILEYNQKLWQFFVDEAMNDANPLPIEIKSNIASLGIFVFKRTREVMIDPTADKLRVLIDINRNIASGLMKSAALSQAAATASTQVKHSATDIGA